ncbi:RES family NAD+ phosphorylase [Phycisphaera mikurensis]|uniref:RES domain-containing protein n=1 Tax=Phycisphaera mikurensis (strain NBRC 102666 / KCTC 22515 / FYK2301M01) TaxID=1142394 RepID=I0IAU0_PHYMF|nr:RES family NAD+ phosphorylase [Phycisphaera mikurensis]BAM02378.1 hypothetical protein PSMK_02190 [Phycisphaera mikurensis NBRC 102666]
MPPPDPQREHVSLAERAAIAQRIKLRLPDLSSWSGVLHRVASPAFARQDDRLAGVGAARFGGRWNPLGLQAVYASFEEATALAESQSIEEFYGLIPDDLRPKTLFRFRAAGLRVLDLTEGSLRNRLRIGEKRLLGCDWRLPPDRSDDGELLAEPLTQAVGRVAAEAGVHALRVPSTRIRGRHNPVVFPRNLPQPDMLQTLHPSDL